MRNGNQLGMFFAFSVLIELLSPEIHSGNKNSRPSHGLPHHRTVHVRHLRFDCRFRLRRSLLHGLMSSYSKTSGQSGDGTEVLSRLSGFDQSALFLRVIALAIHGAQSSKNRCRTNSHSTRTTVGRYSCHCTRFAESSIESVALESLEEKSSLALPTCFPNSFSAVS